MFCNLTATTGSSPKVGKPGRPAAIIKVLAGQVVGHLSLQRVSVRARHAAKDVSGGGYPEASTALLEGKEATSCIMAART